MALPQENQPYHRTQLVERMNFTCNYCTEMENYSDDLVFLAHEKLIMRPLIYLSIVEVFT